MLKRLHVRNFTVFEEAEFEFSPGLNVIVGTNGTGKSHVLKLGYSILANLVDQLEEQRDKLETESPRGAANESLLDFTQHEASDLEDKLPLVFRPVPQRSSELIRRVASRQEAEISYQLTESGISSGSLFIHANGSRETPPTAASHLLKQRDTFFAPPVFIPAKDILTLGWMLPASRQLRLPIDETYLDLLRQLSGLPLQTLEPAAANAIQELTRVLGGEVTEEGGRYYLEYPKQKRMAIELVAEGLRKFGTLQKLLSNGSLTVRATLFWDEPEANQNPALVQKLAVVLIRLAKAGFQIVLATHSVFLLKEIHIQSRREKLKQLTYFGLYTSPAGDTKVETTHDFELLQHISALDAELRQTFDYEETLDQEDADDSGR